MAFKYDRFFELLKSKGISTYKIRKDNLMSQASLTKMRNGEGNIDTRTLERLCALLDCQPCDIMEYVGDSSERSTSSHYINLYSVFSESELSAIKASMASGDTIENFIKRTVLDSLK